jgi:tetratricopeptide (TPR) repeat protein
VERLAATPLDNRTQFDLWMARALLGRTRNAAEREQQAYERALQIATATGDRVLLGIAYGALGKFYEARDGDRAFACYEDSAEFLRDAGSGDAVAAAHYVTTLVRLAWLYAMRNDPRSRAVLDRAESLRGGLAIADDVLGMLEQTWGEYWRRAGELRKALDHKYRALNIFERLADQRSVLVTYLNLSSIHAETREFDRAIDYALRILDLASRQVVEPAIVASTHLNLGATYYWQARYDAAIEQYQLALDCSLRARLRLQANRAHYNLAEAYYKRFQIAGDLEDERRGDLHAAASINAPLAETTQALVEASRTLKAEVLGDQAGPAKDRMLPEESAVHFDEMSDVQRHRAVLAVPMSPEAHVRARLAIANAYLAISVKEREAARQLIERHGLSDSFASAIGQLRETFDRNLTREQRLLEQWKHQAGDLLDEPRRAKLIAHLARDGHINKSGYGVLCAVSAATASKHLVALAERGLLVQTGKGPSTRYLLQE